MNVSDRGLAFIAAHEGFVSRGYLDPAGIVTIGYGFTMRSRVFSSWWRKTHAKPLAVGDPLPRDTANKLLVKLLDSEYAPPVRKALPHLTQPQFDACVSVVYNLGARALTWRWAKALQKGHVAEAAKLLKVTGTTAGGRQLPGLVRRRTDEARLLATGSYGETVAVSGAPSGVDVRDLQNTLKALGHDPGRLDGVWGARTKAAVIAFQRANPPLVLDGVPGPATRAALKRALALRNGTGAAGVLTVATGAGSLLSGHVSLPVLALVILVMAAVSAGGLYLWLNRGAFTLGLRALFSRV